MGITYNIQQRLKGIQETIEYNGSALKAAEYIPEGIQAFQLPLFVNFPQSLERAQVADTYYDLTRSWVMRLYGRYEGDGGRAENERRMYDLIDLVYAKFLTSSRLELSGAPLNDVTASQFGGDNGISISPYPLSADESQLYYVVEFTVTVTYRSICT